MLGLALAAVLLWAPPARESALQWSAPKGCPDQHEVQRRAAELLAAADVDAGSDDIRAAARVRATASGYALDLHIEGGHEAGERHIDAADCSELADAAALIYTIAIHPHPLPAEAAPVIEAAVSPPSIVVPPLPERAPDRDDVRAERVSNSSGHADRPSSTRRALSLGLRAGAGIDVTLWRPVGATLLLGGVLVGRGFRIELSGRYAAPSIVRAPSDPSLHAVAQQWSIALGGCGSPSFERIPQLELPLCASAEAGAMHARGGGSSLAGRPGHAPWAALAFGPMIAWLFASRISLWLSAEGVVLLGRPRFVTNRGTQIVHPHRAGLRILAGAELRFSVRR